MKNILKFTAILLILAGSFSCGEEEKRGIAISPLQDIIFERYYINYAWGYSHSGFMIDKNGLIHVYSQHEIIYSNNNWNFPDDNGYITEENMKENLENTTIAKACINITELHKYAELIALVKENDYSEQQQGADMGAVVNICYLYNDKTHTYKHIVLSAHGDWTRINNNPVAKIIDNWLNTIRIEE
ncbi:MAG: hypothetical protein LBQ28_01980 [Prevotellaceae bacterium]|jgi:hypothetical protein|nr:hypothetical protein [Prevotellaceae bacterium]